MRRRFCLFRYTHATGETVRVQVEIGTAEQRTTILKEFSILQSAAAANVAERIVEVLVPGNFEATVRRLTGNQAFRANRGYNLVLAMTLAVEGGHCLVFSPLLFTEAFDTPVRVSFYLHELGHVVHETRFPPSTDESPATHYYSENLCHLYGDYASQRWSLGACAKLFPHPSDLYIEHHRAAFSGFLDALNDERAYDVLSSALMRFRFRLLNVDEYQQAILPAFDQVAKALAYAASYLDSYTGLEQERPSFDAARFVTNAAQELVAYCADKYEADDLDLSDGVERMKNFTETFGFVLEDHPEGLYCRVVGLPF